MSESRRNFFRNVALVGAGVISWAESLRAQKSHPPGILRMQLSRTEISQASHGHLRWNHLICTTCRYDGRRTKFSA